MKQKLVSSILLMLCSAAAIALPDATSLGVSNPNLISSSNNSRRATPEVVARNQQRQAQHQDGIANLQAKNYALAVSNFQTVLNMEHDGAAYLGLAEALTGQGKITEALQVYHQLFYPSPRESWGGSYFPKAHLEYALLLNQTGQWAEAVAHYNASLAELPGGELKYNVILDPAAPQPAALAAAAHVGLGLYDSFEYEPDSKTKVFQEYAAAQKLAPEWEVANYYYADGWKKLDPKSPLRAANAAQAKAALAKAAASEDAAVKKAAEEEMQGMP